MKSILSILCLGAIAMANAQWTETTYHENKNTWSTTANVSLTAGWTTLFHNRACHFTVTGSSTQSPSWRAVFADICDNEWMFEWSQTFFLNQAAQIPGTETGFAYVDGANAFTRTNPSDSASRSVDGYIVTSYTIVLPGGGGS